MPCLIRLHLIHERHEPGSGLGVPGIPYATRAQAQAQADRWNREDRARTNGLVLLLRWLLGRWSKYEVRTEERMIPTAEESEAYERMMEPER